MSLQGIHCFIICFFTSLLCASLRMSLPLFVMSLYYPFKVSIVSLSLCYVTALFKASTISSSVCYVPTLFKVSNVSLSVCCVIALFWASTVSSSVLLRHYALSLLFLLFHYLLLRQSTSWFPLLHCLFVTSLLCFLGFDCFFLCLLYVTIYAGYFCSPCSSQLLLRGAPDTVPVCLNLTPKRHRQLRVKDFPKVLMWQLKRD